MKVILLLTATINPNNMIFLKRDDSLQRMKDYVKSFQKWISFYKELHKIVICENSGYDLSPFLKIKNQYSNKVDINVLSFEGNKYPRELGKGYGEAGIINYFLNNFKKLQDYDYIVKVTGRLFVRNFKQLISVINLNPDISGIINKNLNYADSRIFLARPEIFQKYFFKMEDEINDSVGIFFEHVLARRIIKALAYKYRFEVFPELPHIIGINGTSGKKINNLKGEIKYSIKKFIYKHVYF